MGPPRDVCERNPQPGNVRENPESLKLSWSNRIKTTASSPISPIEKVASDCLNQNGDKSQSGLSHVIGSLA